MTEIPPIVTLEAADVDVDGQTVLRGIDLRLHVGRHLGIVGANGSGKSTLLALIAGRRWPAPGRGRRVYDFGDGPERDAVSAREKITLLGHELQDLYYARRWNHRARDVVLSGLTRSDIPRRDPSAAALADALALLDAIGLAALADRRLLELSRGEQRRILIARALAFKPALLLLDEPASGLDAEARAGLDATLARAAEVTQLVTAAHREDQLPAVTHEIVTLEGGHIVGRRPGPSARGDSIGRDVPRLKRSPARMPAGAEAADRAEAADGTLIALENASVWLGDRRILERADWQLRAGEHWLVTGANGAGKSTFLRLLHGELRPAVGGRIRWPGLGDPRDIWTLRRRVALVSAELQARYLFPSTVLEAVGSGFKSSIGLTGPLSSAEHAAVGALLAAFDLEPLRDRALGSLSYGQRHRALIARTLAAEPRIVLLDEPWEGLDDAAAALVAAEFRRRMSLGLTVVCVSHIGPGGLPLAHELEIAGGRVSARKLDAGGAAGPHPAAADRSGAVKGNDGASGAPRGSSTSAHRRAGGSRPR